MVKAKQQYYHADGYIKAIGKNARRTIYHPNPRISHRWKRDLHYLVQVRHRAYIVLHPPVVVQPQGASSHMAMWECIHRKEGDWATGYNPAGPYYGGLQMTWDWAYPGWGDARTHSAAEQIAVAEAQYRASGYNLAWLRGQWPRTSYGCI